MSIHRLSTHKLTCQSDAEGLTCNGVHAGEFDDISDQDGQVNLTVTILVRGCLLVVTFSAMYW